MMRCIVVDDEPLVRDLLEDNIRQVPFLKLEASCKHAMEALDAMRKVQVDIMFLDVQMPRLNGLQFLKSLDHPPLVIMVTAYDQYAVESFDLQVVDYLVKPFSFERFLKACNRAAEMLGMKQATTLPSMAKDHGFFVNVEYTHVRINASEIEYVESLKDYIKIFLSSSPKPVLTRMSLKAMEARLPEGTFVRTHKSFLVAVSKITLIKRDFVCVGAKEIPISETFRENISRVLKDH